MGSFVKKITTWSFLIFSMIAFTGCSGQSYEKSESLILEAKELTSYIGKENTAIVDMREPDAYNQGHVEKAINIPVEEIVINVPVKNMLTSKKKIEKLMSQSGISNDTLVLVYDDNNMNASRFLWTMFMYGHENVKVINGGYQALTDAGVEFTTEIPTVTEATFTAGESSKNWLADGDDIKKQIDHPDDMVILLDVRTDEEYYTSGKIPTSLMMSHTNNFYSNDGTFKSVETTRINYLEQKITTDKEIIIYCQTSFRAAPVFLQLYEAGYRNIRIYDGAFLEWSSNSDNPIEMPEGAAPPAKQDAS